MDELKAQLNRIKNKLDLLRKNDRLFKTFGSSSHMYRLNKCLDNEDISAFESKHGCLLPEGYKAFLLDIGNGGAGPNYGLEPLGNSIYADLDFKGEQSLHPGKPFMHDSKWNMNFMPTHSPIQNEELYDKELNDFENEYFDSKYINGCIRINNLGCGIYENLVVTGTEKDNVWTDDRVSEGGINPTLACGGKARINFLDWYELWLDKSLEALT